MLQFIMKYLQDHSIVSINTLNQIKKYLKQYSIQFTDYFCDIREMEVIEKTEKEGTVG